MVTDWWRNQRLGRAIVQTGIDSLSQAAGAIALVIRRALPEQGREEIALCQIAGNPEKLVLPPVRAEDGSCAMAERLRLQDRPRPDRFRKC